MDSNSFLFGLALAALIFLLFFYMSKAHRLEKENEELEEKLEFISKLAYELKQKLEEEK